MNARARWALIAEGWSRHPEHPTVLQKDGIDVGFWPHGEVDVTFSVGDLEETVAFPAGTPGPAVATFCVVLASTPVLAQSSASAEPKRNATLDQEGSGAR